MTSPFPVVLLGDVVKLDVEKCPIEPTQKYPLVGVLSFGKGLFNREVLEGSQTTYKFFYRLKADHIVMSQLFGWEGALALSSSQYAGKYLSPQFPTFTCDPERLDRDFLGWLLQRPSLWYDLGTRAVGIGDRRRTLNPSALLVTKVPLPPLREQKRLVSQIELIMGKVDSARSLRVNADESYDRLLVSMAHRHDLSEEKKRDLGWREVKLGEVMKLSIDSHKVYADRSYPNFGIYSYGKGLFKKPPIDGIATSATTLTRVRESQFVYSRLFAFEGSYGRITSEFDGYFVSSEYPTFDCDLENVLPEYLVAYFKPKHVWADVAKGSKGLGSRRQRVQVPHILQYKIWLPPIAAQRALRAITDHVLASNSDREKINVEFDTLRAAVINAAMANNL